MSAVNSAGGAAYSYASTRFSGSVPDKKNALADQALKISQSTLERMAREQAENKEQKQPESVLAGVATLRNQMMGATKPIDTQGAPTTSSLAFQDFYAHSRVDADTLTNALTSVFSANTGGGDTVSRAIDLSMTQSKLEHIAHTYLNDDYQDQAKALINNFIGKSVDENDAVNRVIYSAAADLAESLGDFRYAEQNRSAIQSLDKHIHASQRQQKEIFAIADATPDMNERLVKFSQYVQKNENNAFFLSVKKEHLQTISQQWADFIKNS